MELPAAAAVETAMGTQGPHAPIALSKLREGDGLAGRQVAGRLRIEPADTPARRARGGSIE